MGRPRVCQPQVTPWIKCETCSCIWSRTWCPNAAPDYAQCAARGARDHGLKVVGLPSRFANFQTDVGSQEGMDSLSPSASPAADDWWSSGLLFIFTPLVQLLTHVRLWLIISTRASLSTALRLRVQVPAAVQQLQKAEAARHQQMPEGSLCCKTERLGRGGEGGRLGRGASGIPCAGCGCRPC